jgi:hypothetical protein
MDRSTDRIFRTVRWARFYDLRAESITVVTKLAA